MVKSCLTEALLELAIENAVTRHAPVPDRPIKSVVDAALIVEKSRFSPVNRRSVGNGEERFEIDDFGILSLANLPVSPSLERPLWNQRVKASFGNRRQQFTVSTYEPRIDSPSITPTLSHWFTYLNAPVAQPERATDF
jgi:hypothetical protein